MNRRIRDEILERVFSENEQVLNMEKMSFVKTKLEELKDDLKNPKNNKLRHIEFDEVSSL